LGFKIITQSAEFRAKNPIVEARVMRNKYAVLGHFDDPFGNLVEFWCRPQHRIVDSGEFDHERLNRDFGIDKADKLIYDFMPIKFVDGDLRDAFFIKLAAGSFYV